MIVLGSVCGIVFAGVLGASVPAQQAQKPKPEVGSKLPVLTFRGKSAVKLLGVLLLIVGFRKLRAARWFKRESA